jgi:hypothetical protein
MNYTYSIVELRRNLSANMSEEPFAVILETPVEKGIKIVLVGKSPSIEGLSIIGKEMANRSKDILIAEIQRALESKQPHGGVLEWLAPNHSMTFSVSNPVTVTAEGDAPDAAFTEAFKLFAHNVIKSDFVMQGVLSEPSSIASSGPFSIPIPQFAEAIPALAA